jgi:hypothetical protein
VITTKFCNYGLLLTLALLLVNITSCKKEELPTLTTMTARKVTGNSAESGGYIAYDGNSEVTSRGIVWSETSNPTIDNYEGKSSAENGPGFFQSTLTGLSPGATYYIRAYATNSVGTSYGEQVSFTTNENGIPILITAPVTDITANTAISGGNVTSDGGNPVTARGVCWSTSLNPTITNDHTNDGFGIGGFTSFIPGLAGNTLYYVRSYATNSEGTAYGSQKSFTTLEPYMQ